MTAGEKSERPADPHTMDSSLAAAAAQAAVVLAGCESAAKDLWTPEQVAWRRAAYLRAVEAYLRATLPRFPVDPRAVADDPYLRPFRHSYEDAPEGAPLADPLGVVYADPLAVAAAAARPSRIAGVALTGCRTVAPLAEARTALFGAGFVWSADFPIAAVRTDGGDILVRHPNNTWTTIATTNIAAPIEIITPRLAAPEATIAPVAAMVAPAEQASALKGARGEARVYEILARRFAVRDVSHRARSSDMIVQAPSCKVLVDAKDYAAAVPDKEVQKFRRDLGARAADAGVLVSLSSAIVGIRGTLVAALEALPLEGRVVPVVYVASDHEDVLAAAVDLAVHLAKFRTLDGLHPRDALEAYVAGLEEVGDLIENARADLGRLASETSAGFGGALERIGHALRDHRRIVRAQRAAIEEPELVAGSHDMYDTLLARYPSLAGVETLAREVLAALSDDRLGDLRASARWHLLKAKAVHVATGAFFGFFKSRTDFGRPLARIAPGRVAAIVARHPKKVRIADESLALELDDATLIDAVDLAGA